MKWYVPSTPSLLLDDATTGAVFTLKATSARKNNTEHPIPIDKMRT